MLVTIIIVAAFTITGLNGQGFFGGGGGAGFRQGFGNGQFAQSSVFNPGLSGQFGQQDPNEPTSVSCITGHNGNSLEVYIRPSQQQFNPFFQFQGRSAQYEIEVKIDSSDLDGPFTVAVTDLSTDNPFCSASELGNIATNGQPQNGLMSLFSGRLNQDSAGVIGEIDLVAGTMSEEYYRNNALFSGFRDFRGLGVGICSTVEGGENSQFHPFFQLPYTPARQTCENPVICCKLGLSRDESRG